MVKSLYWVAGVFVAGLIIGGLLSGSLTGRVSNVNTIATAKTSIFISPSNVGTGDIISVTVDSRSGGASPVLYIRNMQDTRKDRIVWCRGLDDFDNPVARSGGDEDSSCFSRVTFEYKLLQRSYIPGTYYIEVYDDSTGDYTRAYFEVR